MTMKQRQAQARAAQRARMAEARDALAAYWAGSVSASVAAHVEAGAVRVVCAK